MTVTQSPNDDLYRGLGTTERAILERIPVLFLRKLAAGIVRAKMRMQFSGWLQYLLPMIFVLLLSLIGGAAYLLHAKGVANIFFGTGIVLFAIAVFDLVTVKFRLRFPESLPKRREALDLFDLMRARHSCRSFQTRQLTHSDHHELMESVRIHLGEPQIGKAPVRFEYVAAALTVWPVVNATEFLVAIAPKEYDRLAIIDVGYSLQKVVMDATHMGLGTCWIGPGADHASIMQALGERFNPDKDHIICVCAVGYHSKYIPLFLRIFNAQFQRRLPLSQLFFADADFSQSLDLDAAPFSQFGRNYEICQWAPSSYNGQTTRCVAVMDEKENQLERFDFYAATASQYYAPVALGIWCANWELGCNVQSIHGHFAVLPMEKSGDKLPRYDVSWVLDKGVSAHTRQ